MKIVFTNSKLLFKVYKDFFETIATEEIATVNQEIRAFVDVLNGKTGFFRVRKLFDDDIVESFDNIAYFRDNNSYQNRNVIGISKIFFGVSELFASTRINMKVTTPGTYCVDYVSDIDEIPLSVIKENYAAATDISGVALGQPYYLSNPISKNRAIVVESGAYLKCYDNTDFVQTTEELSAGEVINLNDERYSMYTYFRVQSQYNNPIVSIQAL